MENFKCESAWQCSFKIRLLLYNTVKDMVAAYNTVPGAPPMAPILSIPVRERHYEEVIHRSQLLRGTGISRDGASLATVMERLDLTVGQQRACQSVLADQGDKKVALMMTIIFCWVNNAKPAVSKRYVMQVELGANTVVVLKCQRTHSEPSLILVDYLVACLFLSCLKLDVM